MTRGLLALTLALGFPGLALAQDGAGDETVEPSAAEAGQPGATDAEPPAGVAEEDVTSEEGSSDTAETAPAAQTTETSDAPPETAVEEPGAQPGVAGDPRRNPAAARPQTNLERQLNITARPWQVSASAQFRTLATVDEDPANDQYMMYGARFAWNFMPTLSVFVSSGLTQNFSAEEGESGFLLQDTSVGVSFLHKISLTGIGLERDLVVSHTGRVYLPTSRQSQNQDLYLATENVHRARLNVTDAFVLGLDGSFQYRFHQYAERAGLNAGMNTRFILGMSAVAEYTLIDDPDYGAFLLGVDYRTRWHRRYGSRDQYEAETSDSDPWFQDYGWDAYAVYFPMPQLIFMLSLEHNGQVLRDGVVNTFFTHRDETEVALTVMGRY